MNSKKPVNVEERLQILESRGIKDREDIQGLLERCDTPTEKPFTRGEVRRMLIWAAKDSSCSTGETFAQIADRVLKEEGRND